MGCLVLGGRNDTGCFVKGGKNGMGCFVGGGGGVTKTARGYFLRGGELMLNVLSGMSKNGMGCFVRGCFVLHSLCCYGFYFAF